MTPFNSPYTPFSLRKFSTHPEETVEIDSSIEQVLVLLSKCLIPMIWFGKTIDQVVMEVAPIECCESLVFIQVKNILISCCTVIIASIVSMMVFPFVIFFLFLTFPLWMTVLCICFIRFFLSQKPNPQSPPPLRYSRSGTHSKRFSRKNNQ